MDKLTDKQQRFVDEYIVDLNATAAYKRAGYTARNDAVAASGASTLLRNPKVAAAVAVKQAESARGIKVESDRVLTEYLHLAFNDVREVFVNGPDGGLLLRPVREWPENIGRSLSGIKVKRNLEKKDDGSGFTEVETLEFRLWSKTDALEKLAKHLGLLKDGLPLTPDGQALAIRFVEVVRPDGSNTPKPSA